MKKKLSLISTTLFSFLLLIACDPSVKYTMVIQNATEYDIAVTKTGTDTEWTEFSRGDNLIIAPDFGKIVSDYFGVGSLDEFESCPFRSDSFLLKVDGIDTLSVKLNVYKSANWEYDLLEKPFLGGGSCECRLTISDEDIE